MEIFTGMNRVLVTGASGLLGRALVNKFTDEGWPVLAHYFSNRGVDGELCRWIYGDFRSVDGVEGFLKRNGNELRDCSFLVNNYGPITIKNTADLSSDDMNRDFHSNLIVAKVITDHLLRSGNLVGVVNIGFDGVGILRPYRKVLPYAIAKSALQFLTVSYGSEFPGINFSMVSPPSLTGGEYGLAGGPYASPGDVAEEVLRVFKGRNGSVQN